MSDAFLGEIRLFAGDLAPSGWALCDGQLLPISQNTALFAVIGSIFGGDGESTFALPDLRDRAPMQPGLSPGLTPRLLGERGGDAVAMVTASQLPMHNHQLKASGDAADLPDPSAATGGSTAFAQAYRADSNATMSTAALTSTGLGQPHNNLQPYLAMTFIIALAGVFPGAGLAKGTPGTRGAPA